MVTQLLSYGHCLVIKVSTGPLVVFLCHRHPERNLHRFDSSAFLVYRSMNSQVLGSVIQSEKYLEKKILNQWWEILHFQNELLNVSFSKTIFLQTMFHVPVFITALMMVVVGWEPGQRCLGNVREIVSLFIQAFLPSVSVVSNICLHKLLKKMKLRSLHYKCFFFLIFFFR